MTLGGVSFDGTISLGNMLTIAGGLLIAVGYVLDTRYSPKGIRAEIRLLAKGLANLSNEVRKHMDEDREQFDAIRREFGETIAAMRTKITDVELFTRDTFVRRDSFNLALTQQQTLMMNMLTDLKSWMGRIEERVNKIPIRD